MGLLENTGLLAADVALVLDGGECRGRRAVETSGRVAGLEGQVGLGVEVAVGELMGVGVAVVVGYMMI